MPGDNLLSNAPAEARMEAKSGHVSSRCPTDRQLFWRKRVLNSIGLSRPILLQLPLMCKMGGRGEEVVSPKTVN